MQRSESKILIFLKYFDLSKQTLSGIGKVYIKKDDKVAALVIVINEMMLWPSSTPLKLYEVFYDPFRWTYIFLI
jgi:ubiquitin carboxyl-terminal hydrolase 7